MWICICKPQTQNDWLANAFYFLFWKWWRNFSNSICTSPPELLLLSPPLSGDVSLSTSLIAIVGKLLRKLFYSCVIFYVLELFSARLNSSSPKIFRKLCNLFTFITYYFNYTGNLNLYGLLLYNILTIFWCLIGTVIFWFACESTDHLKLLS